MKKWVLKWMRKKSLDAEIIEDKVKFAALHGLLDIHGFLGGGLIMFRMGMKMVRQQSEIIRQQKQQGGQ
jgi:hypothetical protein